MCLTDSSFQERMNIQRAAPRYVCVCENVREKRKGKKKETEQIHRESINYAYFAFSTFSFTVPASRARAEKKETMKK